MFTAILFHVLIIKGSLQSQLPSVFGRKVAGRQLEVALGECLPEGPPDGCRLFGLFLGPVRRSPGAAGKEFVSHVAHQAGETGD